MTKPVTKRELHDALELWAGALRADLRTGLRADLRAEMQAWGHQLSAEIQAWGRQLSAEIQAWGRQLSAETQAWGRQLSAELAQHADRILDTVREMVTVVDEKYADLPARVAALEASALPPKRQRRR